MGALLALIGSCGTWVSASFLGQTREFSGLEGSDGVLTLLLAIVAAVVLGLGAFLPALRSRIWSAVIDQAAAVEILQRALDMEATGNPVGSVLDEEES